MAFMPDEQIKEFAARLLSAAMPPSGDSDGYDTVTSEAAERIVRVLIDLIETKTK